VISVAIAALSSLLMANVLRLLGYRPLVMLVALWWKYPELRLQQWAALPAESLKWTAGSLLQLTALAGLLGVLSGKF